MFGQSKLPIETGRLEVACTAKGKLRRILCQIRSKYCFCGILNRINVGNIICIILYGTFNTIKIDIKSFCFHKTSILIENNFCYKILKKTYRFFCGDSRHK